METESDSNAKKLTTKTVGEIVRDKMKFFIPSYQRGYRWEEPQVTALLNDLKEFEEKSQNGHFYCLQPLVVLKKGEKGDEWEVVDGQQRLTTIFLILRQLAPETPRFQIKYERHPETPSGLEDLLHEVGNSDLPDLHFIREAEKAIKQWQSKNKSRKLNSLTDLAGLCVKFIWHGVDDRKEAMRSFTRLNGGKIKLKDAELIRAVLVRSEGQNEAERHRIALRWDDMERRLQEPEFWAFLNKKEKDKKTAMPVCRMEWLLCLTAPEEKSAKGAADHAVFEWFLAALKNRKPAQLWEEIESCFSTLEEWFEDNRLFHLVGYLTHLGQPVRRLLASAKQFRKNDFCSHLKREIRDKVFDNLASRADISSHLEKLSYEDSEKIRKVLLLFNLAAIYADRSGTIRFSFEAFQEQNWDIEHIHASASRLPESEKEIEGAFAALRDYFKKNERQAELDDIESLLAVLHKSKKEDRSTHEHLRTRYSDLCKEFNQGADSGPTKLDGLWNLGLLYETTNRGYGNSPFAVKRGWILGLDQSELYILPCTRNVFTKAYSSNPVNLLHWTKDDAEDYQKAIRVRLEAFFEDTWVAQQPLPPRTVTASTGVFQQPAKAQESTTAIRFQPKSARVSFLDLFNESNHPQVEIPLLQRDYAQGRKNAERLRVAFLKALHEALNGTKPLNLDFIYGEVNGGSFQPIDGQQRLTTLFLLHWFLAGAANQGDDFRSRMRDADGEPRFRYSVRQSSQRFFNALLDISAESGETKPSCEITNQPWFCLTWKHDPTIAGALVMIKAIADEFKATPNLRALYGKLAESGRSPITFDVLDLRSLGQSEEIYIKMNARGIELTGFEKFKAWLIETHEDRVCPQGAEIQDPWKIRLDGPWLDLFWHFHKDKPSPSEPVSAAFFRTFVALAVNVRASNQDKLDPEWLDESKAYDPANWKDLFTETCVQLVFEQLDTLSRQGSDPWPIITLRQRLGAGSAAPFDGEPLLEPFFEKPDVKLTLEMRLWLHATLLALKASWTAGSREEIHWFRVVRNLLAQTSFDKKNYGNAVKALDALANFARKHGSILEAFGKETLNEVKAVNPGQLAEERLKAEKILSLDGGSKWEQAIINVERHPLFQGQIEVLLQQETDLKTFQHRCSMVKKLWDKGRSLVGRRDEYLLARAILAKSEAINLGWQENINLSDSDANWRSQMSRQDGWPSFRDAVQVVLDSLEGAEDIESALRNQLKTSQVTEPWMCELSDHGDRLLKDSHCKVQQYYQNGVFVYRNPSYTNDEWDILIGETADLRNRLIWHLTKSVGWTFLSGPEKWREVQTSTGVVFFRGHRIHLKKNLQDSLSVSCEFGYHQLTVRVAQGDEKHEVSMDYPKNASPDSLHDLLTKARDGQQNEAVKTVFEDLLQACASLS